MIDVVVLAKRPVPGRVKTRLVPPLSPQQAAQVAAAALLDTLDAVDADGRGRILAFDGDPDGWLRPGWRHVAQPGGGLDERITAALAAAGRPAVLIGMDTPQVRPEQIDAFDPVTHDACFGPAADGGFWAIGFADPRRAAQVVPGVPMSLDTTGEQQLERLRRAGLRVQMLPTLTDVDDISTARRVTAECPDSRFAAALADVLNDAVHL